MMSSNSGAVLFIRAARGGGDIVMGRTGERKKRKKNREPSEREMKRGDFQVLVGELHARTEEYDDT